MGETKFIITGSKYNTNQYFKNNRLPSLAFGVGLADIQSFCKNLFTRSDGDWGVDGRRVDRKTRRAVSAAAAATSSAAGGVYPDTITYNGTKYTDSHRNDRVYKDSAGNVFELNLLGA